MAKRAPIREHTFRRAWALLDGGELIRALELFRAGARRGDPDCAMMVGYCFDVGQGVTQSRNRALFWYQRAAALGDPVGATNVGVIRREQRRWALAERWFRRAVALGNPDALLDLAKLLLETGRPEQAAGALWKLLAERELSEATRDDARDLLKKLSRPPSKP